MSGSLALQDPTPVLEGDNPGTGATVTGVTAYRSKRLDCKGASRGSFQAFWTGSAAGTLTIWTTDDKLASNTDDTGWSQELGVSFPSQPAGSAGSAMFHFFENGARWARVKYENASGTGTLRIIGNTKE